MRRLRTTDGTAVHRKAARYHMSQCQLVQQPLHRALYEEMQARYRRLREAARATEEAEDDAVEAAARADAAELGLENGIRDLDAALGRLDREDGSRGAQATVFPHGFGELIDPESEEQLKVLPALYERVAAFVDSVPVKEAVERLRTEEAGLRAALQAEAAADQQVDKMEAAELEARRAVREQLESAYGRLRDHYKARPQLAERFFLREGARRRSEPEEGAGAKA